jgi:tetratricopeptide (TPR) repeat protein
LPPGEAVPKAREAVLKAIELDEELPEAHHSMALVKWWGDWDWEGAEREFKRALDLNPNIDLTRVHYAGFLSLQKRFEDAIRVIEQARADDPASQRALVQEGEIYLLMRQYDRAIEIFRKALELNNGLARAQRLLSIALSQQGRHQEAIAQTSQFQTPVMISVKAYIYARAGQQGEALKLLRELKTRAAIEIVPSVSFARIYVGLGAREKALVWLRKAYLERSDHLVSVGAYLEFEPLHSDPRFEELLRDIGLRR